jgi:hypothetical protein
MSLRACVGNFSALSTRDQGLLMATKYAGMADAGQNGGLPLSGG